MKNTFCIRVLALSLAALLFCTGCAARSPVEAGRFQTAAEAVGFTVEVENSPSNTELVSYAAASMESSDTIAEFISFQKESGAVDLYKSLRDTLPGEGETTKTKSVDTAAYTRLSIENGELYYVLVRMGPTVLFCKSDLANREKIDALLGDIRY